jgi:hypothetical protein
MLLLLAITLCSNWEKEVSESTKLPACPDTLVSPCLLMPWPRSFVISAGFEGKGQNFHFIPTSRHDDMKRASHTILLEAMANKL